MENQPNQQMSGSAFGQGVQGLGSQPPHFAQRQPQSYPQDAEPQPPAAPMPSLAGPIVTIVIGALLMIVVAPLVGVLLSLKLLVDVTADFAPLLVENGDTVVVNDEGMFGVFSLEEEVGTCTLDGTGSTYTLAPSSVEGVEILVARDVPPGQYTFVCDGVPLGEVFTVAPKVLVVGPEETLTGGISAFSLALLWSSAIGVVGLALLIFGIVWLVRRNRARKSLVRPY